ncbi:MAG: NAD(P)-binding domain-containing protein [Planctomycetes bacterium]|nr:NAD(P)-binding domain-containing protein [Planctomycetota bacterium]
MSFAALALLVAALAFALLCAWARRRELAGMEQAVTQQRAAERRGSARAQLQHPFVDLSRCLGCGKCVEACPEAGVLQMVHGQAAVVNGARCVGHAACERECPVGAITVTLADAGERRDVPALSPELEAIGTPGLFLAGEVTAHALIHVAIGQGVQAVDTIARRLAPDPQSAAPGSEARAHDAPLDLAIVGAGPAGLAAALEAKRQGLRFVVLEHESSLGGTVAKYPRKKLVVTRPIELPLHGRVLQHEFVKEELVALWQSIAACHALPIEHGHELREVHRTDPTERVVSDATADHSATFELVTSRATVRARFVVLALGRRGLPRRLGVPGEELAKVAYSLQDARAYQRRRVLVVGGGESAVEAAVGLAEQPGTEVILSYRQDGFFRLRPESEARLGEQVRARRVRLLLQSEVTAITPERVDLALKRGEVVEPLTVANDDLFVLAGGTPPFPLLERAGVSFDPALRPPPRAVAEQGSGLLRALAIGFLLASGAFAFALWHRDYYTLPARSRPLHASHEWLRPSDGIGLAFGIAAAALVVVNLLYVVRRGARGRFALGSLQAWMTSHVATGILAFLLAALHAALDPRDSVGGHSFLALGLLLLTGAVGRYLYAWLPRAANGRELALAEARAKLAAITRPDGSEPPFFAKARAQVVALVEAQPWRGTFLHRIGALLSTQQSLRRALRTLAEQGARDGVAPADVKRALALARRAHRAALMIARFEELRALASSWRFLHRWLAALMVLLVAIHVGCALLYGGGP